MTLDPGSSLGPYKIVDQLGRGGMATVYKAHEPSLDRYVALKVLSADFLHDENFAERFRREANVIARLEHPNIVPIHASGIDDDTPWMAMRFIPSGALSELLRAERLGKERILEILSSVAKALDYAHAEGVVHRDVKPQNILLDRAGAVYLSDFGIAKMVGHSAGELTKSGVIGTPEYMSPEQAHGRDIDSRSDVYSLGVLAFKMLTGRVPFSADTPVAVLMKHVSEPVPLLPISDVSEPIQSVLLKCLEKKPSDRWTTAGEFVEALGRATSEVGAENGLGEARPTAPSPTTVLETSPLDDAGGPSAEPVSEALEAWDEAEAPVKARLSQRYWWTTRAVLILLLAVGITLLLTRGPIQPELPAPTEDSASGARGPWESSEPGRVRFDFQDEALLDVLRLFPDIGGPGVIIDPGISGRVTRSFLDVSWEECFQEVLESHGLAYSLRGNVAWIVTRDRVAEAIARLQEDPLAAEEVAVLGPAAVAAAPILEGRLEDPDERVATLSAAALASINPVLSLDSVHEPVIGVVEEGDDRLDLTQDLGPPKYSGDHVDLDFSEADLSTVVARFNEITGLDMLLDEGLRGKVTLRVKDAPWDQVLEMLLWSHRLGYLPTDGVLRVVERAGVQDMGGFHREIPQEFLERACNAGSVANCVKVAGLLHGSDDARAAEFLERACTGGRADACHSLGVMLAQGKGVEKSLDLAAQYYEIGCDGGAGHACSNLAHAYEEGQGVPVDDARAATLHGRACDLGLGAACYRLGRRHEEVDQDPVRAAAAYERACEAGYLSACGRLGFLYSRGEGVAQDQARATQYWARAAQALEEACEGGGAAGCRKLGVRYHEGDVIPQDLPRAARLYERACEGDDADACTRLGAMLVDGEGVAEDPARAADHFRKACEAGNSAGCSSLGWCYSQGIGVEQDFARARVLWTKAHEMGEGAGSDNLGQLYEWGQGVRKDMSHAAELYQEACKRGSAGGCVHLGQLYLDGRGVSKDQPRAVALLKDACDDDDAQGCYYLGKAHAEGQAVEKDPERAAELYQKACDGKEKRGCFEVYQVACLGGDADGCNKLGRLYELGEGVDQDSSRAAELYQGTCDSGSAEGCFRLGWVYEEGDGVPQDLGRTARLFRSACGNGFWRACFKAGMAYNVGQGVEENRKLASSLFTRGCSRGNEPESCGSLAHLYEVGEGVEKDLTRAAELYQRACDGGLARDCVRLGFLYKEGTGVPQDKEKAVEIILRACDEISSESRALTGCTKIGDHYEQSDSMRDLDRAVFLYELGCEKGEAASCTSLERLQEQQARKGVGSQTRE